MVTVAVIYQFGESRAGGQFLRTDNLSALAKCSLSDLCPMVHSPGSGKRMRIETSSGLDSLREIALDHVADLVEEARVFEALGRA